MKIYFEDGKLVNIKQLPIAPDYVIDASDGVTACMNMLDRIYSTNRDAVVYTNSIIAFSIRYAWNEERKIPDVYIRGGEYMEFTNIALLTNRQLREGHNLAKLYLGGEFRQERKGKIMDKSGVINGQTYEETNQTAKTA